MTWHLLYRGAAREAKHRRPARQLSREAAKIILSGASPAWQRRLAPPAAAVRAGIIIVRRIIIEIMRGEPKRPVARAATSDLAAICQARRICAD